MTTLYKLTTQDWKTRAGYDNETLWGPGITRKGTGKGKLCSKGFIHAYTHPLLAVLFNPIHANIANPVLWQCRGTIAKSDYGIKVGCVELTTIRRHKLPEITTVQKIAFGILCAKQTITNAAWNLWADNWLSGKDRSAATATAYAAYATTYTTATATAYAATATATAPYAPSATAYAASYAATSQTLNLITLAKQAMAY